MLDDVISSLRDASVKFAAEQAMKYIVTAIPLFGVPVLSPILAWVVGKVASVLVEKTELGLFFLRMNALTDAQAATYAAAQQKLQGATNDADRKKAEDAVVAAARDLLKLTH